MSVTFAPSITATPMYSFTCKGCGAVVSGESFAFVYDSYDEHFYACENTSGVDQMFADERMGVQANFSNENARDILALLGVTLDEDGDLFGSMSAQDMMGRILIAEGVNQESGFCPAVVTGNMVNCGRHENYYQDALAYLREVAQVATDLQVDVIWS